MEIEFDENKRRKVLEERGIDIAEAELVFESNYIELPDDRKDYGEIRYRVWGYLHGRRVSLVWTPRGKRKRIITMRHAHEQEHDSRKKTLD